MGGQVGDVGVLDSRAEPPRSGGLTDAPSAPPLAPRSAGVFGTFDVESTKVIGGYVLHIGRLRSGTIQVGQTVTATVGEPRVATEKNHTTTHLANWALREVLGDSVQQKGSLVDPDKLRFDFSHGKSLSDDELEKVESLVSQSIGRKLPVYAEEAAQELALKINGLRAVFGEKYPPKVRVVSVGVPVADLLADPTNAKWRQYSVEFCGGTHLGNSGDAAGFAITAEESVSTGIRRLVGVTGPAATAAAGAARAADATIATAKSAADDQLSPLIAALNTAVTGGTLPLRAKRRAQAAVLELQARQKAHEKSAKKSTGTDAVAAAAELLAAAPSIGPGKLVVGEIAGATDDGLRAAVDSIKSKSPSYGVMLAAAIDGKVTFIAAVSDDLIAKGLKAGDWIRETAKVAGGGGGGRPQMAQAGGKDPGKIGEALAKARAFATAAIPQ
jgi:alanyl-tRNA synthetase